MAIRFPCSQCGRMMRAPDSAAGRRAKCPLCGAIGVIPSADQPAASGPAAGATASPTAGLAIEQPPNIGQFVIDCLKAIAYGASNFGSLFILVVYAVGAIILFFVVASLLFALGVIVMGAGCLVVYGIYLRFYLDVVISSLEGVNQAPNVPPFEFSKLFTTGVKGLGILVVYVLPIVTIPLLPLGLLALAYSDDNRAYDVFWAARAACKRPGQLLILWPILVLWIVAGYVATMYLNALLALVVGALAAGGGCIGFLIGLGISAVGWAAVLAVDVMFTTAAFRCIGMLGRHNPILTDMLPDSDTPLRAAAFIVAGVAVSAVVWFGIIQGVLPAVSAPA